MTGGTKGVGEAVVARLRDAGAKVLTATTALIGRLAAAAGSDEQAARQRLMD